MNVGRTRPYIVPMADTERPRLSPTQLAIDSYNAGRDVWSRRPCARALNRFGVRVPKDGLADKLMHEMLCSTIASMIAVPIGVLLGFQLVTIQVIAAAALLSYAHRNALLGQTRN